MGDLDGRPTELEDDDEHRVVEHLARFRGVFARYTRRKYEGEGADYANRSDQMPGFSFSISES